MRCEGAEDVGFDMIHPKGHEGLVTKRGAMDLLRPKVKSGAINVAQQQKNGNIIYLIYRKDDKNRLSNRSS
jgi:hypothetical protein